MALNNLWFLTEYLKSVNKTSPTKCKKGIYLQLWAEDPTAKPARMRTIHIFMVKVEQNGWGEGSCRRLYSLPGPGPTPSKNGVQAPSAPFYSGRCVLVKPVCQETQQVGAQLKIPKQHEHHRREVSLLITSLWKVTVKPISQRYRDVTVICLLVTDWGGARESAHLISVMTIFGITVSMLFTRLVFFLFSFISKKKKSRQND